GIRHRSRPVGQLTRPQRIVGQGRGTVAEVDDRHPPVGELPGHPASPRVATASGCGLGATATTFLSIVRASVSTHPPRSDGRQPRYPEARAALPCFSAFALAASRLRLSPAVYRYFLPLSPHW